MRITLILGCLLLTACMATPEPDASAAVTPTPEKDSNNGMSDAIHAPIEKAEKVEDQVIDGAEKQRAEIEAAGG